MGCVGQSVYRLHALAMATATFVWLVVILAVGSGLKDSYPFNNVSLPIPDRVKVCQLNFMIL